MTAETMNIVLLHLHQVTAGQTGVITRKEDITDFLLPPLMADTPYHPSPGTDPMAQIAEEDHPRLPAATLISLVMVLRDPVAPANLTRGTQDVAAVTRETREKEDIQRMTAQIVIARIGIVLIGMITGALQGRGEMDGQGVEVRIVGTKAGGITGIGTRTFTVEDRSATAVQTLAHDFRYGIGRCQGSYFEMTLDHKRGHWLLRNRLQRLHTLGLRAFYYDPVVYGTDGVFVIHGDYWGVPVSYTRILPASVVLEMELVSRGVLIPVRR
jgi:hypothetical protein